VNVIHIQLIIVPMVTTDKLYMHDDLQIEVGKLLSNSQQFFQIMVAL